MADAIETQTQQVTSETPATKPAKNPKRVAAGKLTAEKTRQAREAQKKAAEAAAQKDTPAPAPPQPQPQPADDAAAASSISTTQWLAIGSFVISLIGLYYKREEVKAAFSSRPAAITPVESAPTLVAKQPVAPSKTPLPNKNSLRSMD